MYMIPGLQQAPGTRPRPPKYLRALRYFMFLSELPPVLRNHFRPDAPTSILVSERRTRAARCQPAECTHAPLHRQGFPRIMPLPYYAFLLLYEFAFRMDRKKGLEERINDTKFWISQKKNRRSSDVALGEGGWRKEGGKKARLPLIEVGKLFRPGRRAPRLYASRSRREPCI